jgi:ATP-dependent protease ClpP protease subunit
MLLNNITLKTKYNNHEEYLKSNKILNVKTTSDLSILFTPELTYSFIIDNFNNKTLYDFIDFHNEFESKQFDYKTAIPLNIYINSPGGYLYVFNIIKDIIENSNLTITLISGGEISSAAFLLLYFTRNVQKRILPDSISVMHSPTSSFDYRDLLKSFSSTEQNRFTYLSQLNDTYLEIFKELNVFNEKELDLMKKGEDLFLTGKNLHDIFLNCPFGSYSFDPLYFEDSEPEKPITENNDFHITEENEVIVHTNEQ